MSRKHGFTTIELVIVIAIVGILAAIAIPRFMARTTSARVAALNELALAVNSTVELAQAEYVAENNTSASPATTIKMNGATVIVMAGSGRLAGSAAGIGAVLPKNGNFMVNYAPGITTFEFMPAVANCKLTYADSTGVVAITASGC